MNRHKLLFIVAYLVMPVILAWVGYLLFNYDPTNPAKVADTFSYSPTASGTVYYDLPRVSLSMASAAGANGTMKVDLSLEIARQDLERVVDYAPRIMDRVVMYMGKQDFDEMRQPRNAKELRDGLEHEINGGALPVRIAGVIVREMVLE